MLIEDQCISRIARKKFVRRVPAKKACEKHMTRSWRVVPGYQFHEYFVGKAFPWDIREIPARLSTWRIFYVTFLPFTHIIYTIITHKSIKEAIQRENP